MRPGTRGATLSSAHRHNTAVVAAAPGGLFVRGSAGRSSASSRAAVCFALIVALITAVSVHRVAVSAPSAGDVRPYHHHVVASPSRRDSNSNVTLQPSTAAAVARKEEEVNALAARRSPTPAPFYRLGLFDPAVEGEGAQWMRKVIDRNNGTVAFEEWLVKQRLPGIGRSVIPTRGSIFVSVAAYRDEECLPTLASLFEQAEFPEMIFVGLVDQRAMGRGVSGPAAPRHVKDVPDAPCFDAEAMCQRDSPTTFDFAPHLSRLCRLRGQIRIAHVPRVMARGPTFGRYVANMMRRNESYFMMIDSHSRFARHWDTRTKAQLHTVMKESAHIKTVLSTYPDAWRNPQDGSDVGLPTLPGSPQPALATPKSNGGPEALEGRNTTTYLCEAKFLQTGIPRLQGVIAPVLPGKAARPQPWAGAGFLFGPAAMVDQVPFDPYLDYLFDGEEILFSVRLWTSGWNFYSPGESVIFHYYYRKRAKKVFGDNRDWAVPQLRSIHRVQHILRLTPVSRDMLSWSKLSGVPPPDADSRVYRELDRYGLGSVRKLADYWAFAGADPVRRTFSKNWCQTFYHKAKP